MGRPMKIAIVNDLPLAVALLRRLVSSVPDYQVAWTAANGVEAVEKCARDRPDLILMDLIMPVMDGAQATAEIMRKTPCGVLVVTATVEGNASKVFEALGAGALDAVATPGPAEGGAELLVKISRLRRIIEAGGGERSGVQAASLPRLVAIGSSTGGPKALATLLRGLPADLDAAVAIVQHLDVQFVNGLAQWLNEQSALPVSLALEGMKPEVGSVFVAATNDHLVMREDMAFHYTPEPADYPYRPSVDEFFTSVRRHWRRSGSAVVLTGMGRDGARGLLALREAGWHTLAQDEKTSIVYGMPRAAAEAGAAVEVLPLSGMAPSIVAQAGRRKTS